MDNNNQPNEPENQPKVSDPPDMLPEVTIQDILGVNPQVTVPILT